MTRPTAPAAPGTAQAGLLGQLSRFLVVGLLGAVVDLSVYHLGLAAGLPFTAARALSFAAGTSTAYVLNRRWAFRSEGGARRAGGFVVLYGSTFLVILAVNAVALAVLPDEGWRVVLAWAVSQGFGTVCNFVVLRRFVFRR